MLKDPVGSVLGFGLQNESYQFCVATNLVEHRLQIVDLHKGKEVKASSSSSSSSSERLNGVRTEMAAICFFELELSSHCVAVDGRGKMTTFSVSESAGTVEPQLEFESRLKRQAVAVGVTFDNQYLCAVSRDEFVLFAFDPLRFLELHALPRAFRCDGMLVLDKYFYGLIHDIKATAIPTDDDSDGGGAMDDDGDGGRTLNHFVDADYLFNASAHRMSMAGNAGNGVF